MEDLELQILFRCYKLSPLGSSSVLAVCGAIYFDLASRDHLTKGVRLVRWMAAFLAIRDPQNFLRTKHDIIISRIGLYLRYAISDERFSTVWMTSNLREDDGGVSSVCLILESNVRRCTYFPHQFQ